MGWRKVLVAAVVEEGRTLGVAGRMFLRSTEDRI